MKILAIRGTNLNSLADHFEVRLDSGPLAGVGLFAITGPTGAGKSTLLDALCVALYGRVPRMPGVVGPSVGRADEEGNQRIGAYDARNLMRRGTGSCTAEVEFLGKDGRVYRASWSVRRARGKPDGSWQAATMTLVDAQTGETLGGTRTETLEAIVGKLGLSFEQFRRSALLAQGEFDKFLKATSDDRADLLERITGTGIYSELSRAAHARAKEEAEKLGRLQRTLDDIPRLSPEERQALEVARDEASSRKAALEAEQTALVEAANWYARRRERVANVERADGALEEAKAALHALFALQVELALARRAETVRPSYDEDAKAREALSIAQAACAGAERGREEARAEVERRQGAHQVAWDALERATADERQAAAGLEAAEGLDHRLAALQAKVQEVEEELRRTKVRVGLCTGKVDASVRALEAAQTELATLTQWLTVNASTAPLAERWELFEAELRRAERAIAAHLRARQSHQRLAQQRTAAERRRDLCEAARTEAEEACARAAAEANAAAAQAEAFPLEETRAALKACVARLGLVEAAIQAATAIGELTEASRLARQRAEGHWQTAEATNAAARVAQARLEQLVGQVAEARHALERLRATLGLDAHRAQLREGEPCPLCGGTEHPYAREAPRLSGLEQEASSRLLALEDEQERVRTEFARLSAEALEATKSGGHSAEEAAAKEAELAARLSRWPECPDAPAWRENLRVELEALRARLKVERSALEAEEERRQSFVQGAMDAARRRQSFAEALAVASDAQAQALSAMEALNAKCQAEEDEASRQQLLEAEALEQLEGARLGDGWKERLRSEGEALRFQCAARVQAWRREQARASELQALCARVTGELERERAQLSEAVAEEQRREENVTVVRSSAQALANDRRALFDGAPTSTVRARLRRAVEVASAALEAEAARLTAAKLGAARAEQQHASAAEQVALCGARAGQAAVALESALASAGLPRAEVERLLRRGAEWTVSESQRLALVERGVEKAQAVAEDRRRELSQFLTSGAPAFSEDEAAQGAARVRTALEALGQSLGGITLKLEQDDAALRQHGERVAELEGFRQKEAVWRTLAQLVGSHDGKAFRLFAQSLTLEALLVPANAHLSTLAPRYRLMRIPGHDLDLQVIDRDMGDEVRGIPSLSGGESFLVSLSLALGLSSLSASQTPVETLFIDEGFGTLDAEMLETVVSVLDSLQATGRQVGVISHVAGLAERIGCQVRVERLGQGRSRVRAVSSRSF